MVQLDFKQSTIITSLEKGSLSALQLSRIIFGKQKNQSPYKTQINRILYGMEKLDLVQVDKSLRPPLWSTRDSNDESTISTPLEESLSLEESPISNILQLPKISSLSGLQTEETSTNHIIVLDLDQRADCIGFIDNYKSHKLICLASHTYNGPIPALYKLIRATSNKKGEVYNRFLMYLGQLLIDSSNNIKHITIYSNTKNYQSLPDILSDRGIVCDIK